MPFGQLKSSLFANDETVPSGAIFAIELLRQFATKTSPVCWLIAMPYRAAETTGDKGLRLAFSIDLGDRIAVEVRLQKIALVVNGVT
jgi:hypothetical protein